MANDAEVKIKVGTQLDKNSVKADVSSIGGYLKDTERSVANVSKAYNKMPKTMNEAIRVQKQLNATIYRFKTVLFDVYDTMRKIDSTDFSAFDASVKRVIPEVQKLKAEVGWSIAHFSKMGTPDNDSKGFETRLNTLKSMESILHSIYTAWFNIEKAWGSDTDKLSASAVSVKNFLDTLKNAETIPIFKNITSEVREMSATMRASEAAYASNMKAFRDAVSSGSRDVEKLLSLYNSVYNTQALLVDKSMVSSNGVLSAQKDDAEQLLKSYNSLYNAQALFVDKSKDLNKVLLITQKTDEEILRSKGLQVGALQAEVNGYNDMWTSAARVLEQHKPLLLTMKEERDVLEDINKQTSSNGKEVDIKVGAKLDTNAISRVVKEAESAIGKQGLKTTFYDSLSKVTSDLASNTEKSTSLMGDYDRLIEDVLSKLTQIKNSDALSAVLQDSQKYVKSFGDVLSKVETGIFSVKGNDYSGFTQSLDKSIDSIRVLNAYVGQLALSFDKMYTESGAGVKYVVPEISDVQASLIRVSNILSTLEDTYDKLHVQTGAWTTSTKSLSNTMGTVRDLFKEITADSDVDILQKVNKSTATRSIKPMSMTTGLTDITNVFKDITALTKDMDTPGIYFGEIPYRVKDFITQLDKLGISVKQVNSEIRNTTASVTGLNNEVSKTADKVSEVKAEVKDTGKAASDISLEKVETQLDTVKEKAKEASEQLSKAGEDAKSVQIADVKKPITIAPTEEQYKDARREIESMIDETDRGTAELNKWQRTMMNAFKVFFDEFSRVNNAVANQDFTGYIDDDLNKLFAKVKTSVLLIQEFTQKHILEGNALSKMMTNYLNNIGLTTKADKEDFKQAFDYTSISSFKKTLEKMLKDYTTAANKLQELREAEEQAAQSAKDLGTETANVDVSKPVEQTKELKGNVTEVATATKEASAETKKELTEEEKQALEAKKAIQELKDEIRAAVLEFPDEKAPEAWRIATIKAFTQIYSSYMKFLDLAKAAGGIVKAEVADLNVSDIIKEFEAAISVIEDYKKSAYAGKDEGAGALAYAKNYARETVLGITNPDAVRDLDNSLRDNIEQFTKIGYSSSYSSIPTFMRALQSDLEDIVNGVKDGTIQITESQKEVSDSAKESASQVSDSSKTVIDSKQKEVTLVQRISDAEAKVLKESSEEGTAELRKALDERTKLRKEQLASEKDYVDPTSKYKDTYKDTLKSIDKKTRTDEAKQDLDTEIKLRKEIARINRSTATEEQKSKKILAAQEASAAESNYKKTLGYLDARNKKYLAFIETWKKANLASEGEVNTRALKDLETQHENEMSKIDAAQLALDDKAQYLTKRLLAVRQEEIDKRKEAEMNNYEQQKSNLLKIHELSTNLINQRSEKAAEAVEKSTRNRKGTAKLAYLDSLGQTSTSATSATEAAKDEAKAASTVINKTNEEVVASQKDAFNTLKTEIDKVANLFAKGMHKAWTSYVKYGKSAINTISNLFKGTLQKTYQGTLKITEVMGLRGGVKEVNSVTDALGKLKSQLLGIAGISISFRTLFGLKDASSELVEIQNVVHTVFEDLEDSVNEFADQSRTTFGLTEYQAKKFTSIFGSMFKTAGTSTEAAKVMGENLTALSADLASFFDADFTEAFDKVKSGLSGMIMPLRSYGIDLSVASMKQYMLDKGIQASWADLSIAQKQMVRYNYMLERTTMMQGDFNKTIGTWANQMRILKNQFHELAIIAGAFIEKNVYPIIVGLNDVLRVAVKVGKELQEVFGFTLKDIQIQQGQEEGTERGISIGTTYDEDAADATEDLADSTDKLTESKKKLQKQNERQEASFDSLIKLTKKSTDTTDDNTKSTNKNKKNKVDLDLDPADYKKFEVKGKEAELPKWANKLISWIKEVQDLFGKYSPAIKRELKDLKKAWAPVLETLGKGVQWLWKNVLKPFLEWFLGTALPKTIRLATVVGGVVDSILAPIGEAIKKLWEYPLKPFFKAIGDKYVKWVESSTDSLKDWKAQFDALDSTDAKLEFLKVSIKNFFENTIRKYFGERSEEILDQFYKNFDTVGDILGAIFASTDEIAQGKLFSDEFLEAVENLGSAFVLLGQITFGNILTLISTLTGNIGDVSEIGGTLVDNFGKIETMAFGGVNTLLGTLINNKDSVKETSNSVTDLVTAVGNTVFKGLNDCLDKLLKSGTASDYIDIVKDALVRISELVFENVGELIDWLGESDTKETVKNIRDNLIDAFDNVTKFFQDNKDTILDFVEQITNFITFASEHPDLLVAVLIGGKLLSGLASVSSTVWNIYKGFTLLGTEGVASLLGLLGPLGLIVAILTEAFGFVMGMKEQWDNQNNSIDTVASTMASNMKKIADLDSTVPADRSNMEKYSKLLDSVGLSVTSTGFVMYKYQGKYKKFAQAVQDASTLSEGEFNRLKQALVDFGAVTQEEADKMSKQDVVNMMYEQVNIAGGNLEKTLRENGQTLKDLTAESAQDIESWTDDVWSKVTDSIDEEKWFNKLGQGWDLVSGELKETIGQGTAEIAQMTGELPAAVINDVNELIKNGASNDLIKEYFANYKKSLEEVSSTTDDTAETISNASDSFTQSTEEVQKSADEVNLDKAVDSIKELADAYDDATDASNNMKLSSSIDTLKEYYTQLYASGKISSEEFGSQIARLAGYEEDLEKGTDGILDVLRNAKQSQNSELDLFPEEFTKKFQKIQDSYGDDIEGFEAYLKANLDNFGLTDEQKKVFNEQLFPVMDEITKKGIANTLKNEVIEIKNQGVNEANKEKGTKLDIEATIPDKDSPEASKAKAKAKESGKEVGKEVKKGAQEETNKGKLSTETYINNGSENNKEVAKKEGTKTGKTITEAAQEYADSKSVSMGTALENADAENKTKATKEGNKAGATAVSSMQNTVSASRVNLADSLDIQITQNKVLYVAACIQNLLVSAMSRIHTVDLSTKLSFSGSSQNLPLAYSAPVYTSGRVGNLPHLAKGAVIPPRSKFLAVLGDQRSGYNIETPLDTMIDAFKIALQDTGLLNKGTDQPIQLTVQIGSEKLDDRIVNVVDSRNTRSGGL